MGIRIKRGIDGKTEREKMFEVYAAIANEWLRGKAMISQLNGRMLLLLKEGENRRREMIKERDKEEKKSL